MSAMPQGFEPPHVPDHELLRRIGIGAYGEVWLARNATGSFRAVKVVRRDSFDSDRPYQREFEGIQRFEPVSHARESQVDIFHVGINSAAGYFYYSMELADDANAECGTRSAESPAGPHPQPLSHPMGEGGRRPGEGIPHSAIHNPHSYVPRTLKHDLQQQGRLPLEQCIEIGLALTTALEHLHANGLVHRDIKPSNVIFVNGVPKLADIGLVAALDATMSFVGTAGYVPPEGPGKPAGDLYSLGKVLYEISAGRDTTRFPELPTAWEEFADQKGQLELNAIILKACAHDPKQRYQSAREMHDDLALLQRGKSVRAKHTRQQQHALATKLGLGALAILLVGGVGYALKQSTPQPVATNRASIFVLPFRNADTNRVETDLRDRITDAFIDSLPLIEGVRTGPRKSGWIHRNEGEVRREVGKAFNVRHALTGRVATPPGQVSIEISLFETDGDRKLWSETFLGTTNEVIELETKAIHRITSMLGLTITVEEERQIHQTLTNNLEALRLRRLASAYEVQTTKRSSTLATEALNRALDLDPNYLDADLTAAYVLRGQIEDRPPREIWPEIKTRMQKILRVDDTHFGAHFWLLSCQSGYEWDWDGFQAGFERLRKEQPEGWDIQYRMLGRTNEARAVREKYERATDPTIKRSDNYYYHGAAARHYTERRHDDAIKLAKEGLKWYPNHPHLIELLARCLIEKQDYTNALATLDKVLVVERKQSLLATAAYACARMGDRPAAMERLEELEMVAKRAYLQPYYLARVYAALGDKQEVWKWLNKAAEERSEWLVNADMGGLRTDPAWDGLREEPEFKKLLKEVDLDVWPR